MMDWEELEQTCKNCTKCGLCETRNHVVFGVGPRNADVMFVGEGPGENEDLQGEPFVGKAGQLLDKYLEVKISDIDKNLSNIVISRFLFHKICGVSLEVMVE